MNDKYKNCTIKNIERGKGKHSDTIYADLISETGELLISATLSYICDELRDRVPPQES